MSAVMSSVAFLEARINEIFAEVAEPRGGLFCIGISKSDRDSLRSVWNQDSAHRPTLEKYALALTSTGRQRIAGARHENALLLVRLRNHLVHFDGEWTQVPIYGEGALPQRDRHLLERSLRGKFDLCRLSGLDLFFPDQCLGSGCAKWATKSAHDFVREFSSAIGVIEPCSPPPSISREREG